MLPACRFNVIFSCPLLQTASTATKFARNEFLFSLFMTSPTDKTNAACRPTQHDCERGNAPSFYTTTTTRTCSCCYCCCCCCCHNHCRQTRCTVSYLGFMCICFQLWTQSAEARTQVKRLSIVLPSTAKQHNMTF